MILTFAEVEHIAELARLELTEEELARYREQLSTVLDYFEQLQEVDTTAIPPTSSVLLAESSLRADETSPGLDLKDLLRNAPQVESDQFQVPPVLE
jgi:aspartyl-tRNA(Asn)/glutamyl-tRNA(Gln) amidotransferase subunit C